MSENSVLLEERVANHPDAIRALLHMAAVSIVSHKGGELNGYYLRKVAEGKNKMSVINAVRAKLVARMFAVVKNNQPYRSILS